MSKETRVIAGNEKFVKAQHSIREQTIVSTILTETEIAQKFMQVYKEYGNEIDNRNVYSSLGYSQAFELLAVPSDEREKFAEEIGAKDLTITELREEIKAMKDGRAAAD